MFRLLEWNGPKVTMAVRKAMKAKLLAIGKEVEGYAKWHTTPGAVGPPKPPGYPATGRSGTLRSEYHTFAIDTMHVRVAGGLHALWTELGTGLGHHLPLGEDFALTADERPALRPKEDKDEYGKDKYLMFHTWEGAFHKVKSVRGQEPRPVLRPSVMLAKRKALEILSQEVELK